MAPPLVQSLIADFDARIADIETLLLHRRGGSAELLGELLALRDRLARLRDSLIRDWAAEADPAERSSRRVRNT